MAYDMGRAMRGSFLNRGLSPRIRFLPRYSSKLATQNAIAASEAAEFAPPQFIGISAGLIAAGIVSLSLVWVIGTPQPAACEPSPLVFRIGSDVETDLNLRAGAQCPVYVLPGQATLDEPIVVAAPLHGSVAPRGHTGITYRPEAGFRGEDRFAVTLNGKTEQKTGSMVIRVRATVQ
jgi:hypothetical protein